MLVYPDEEELLSAADDAQVPPEVRTAFLGVDSSAKFLE